MSGPGDHDYAGIAGFQPARGQTAAPTNALARAGSAGFQPARGRTAAPTNDLARAGSAGFQPARGQSAGRPNALARAGSAGFQPARGQSAGRPSASELTAQIPDGKTIEACVGFAHVPAGSRRSQRERADGANPGQRGRPVASPPDSPSGLTGTATVPALAGTPRPRTISTTRWGASSSMKT